MVTVDQMIAALEAFKAEHGGDRQVVKCDPHGKYDFMELNNVPMPSAVVESDRLGYFDMDDEVPNSVPVLVMD